MYLWPLDLFPINETEHTELFFNQNLFVGFCFLKKINSHHTVLIYYLNEANNFTVTETTADLEYKLGNDDFVYIWNISLILSTAKEQLNI